MALSDIAIKNAKPGAKPVKLADGGRMFLLVVSSGSKDRFRRFLVDKTTIFRRISGGLGDTRHAF
jgi:hypothetical protein